MQMFRRAKTTFYVPPPLDAPLPRQVSSSRQPTVLAVGEGGRYRLEERIGRGSFGHVYRGVDMRSSNQRKVAVKLEAIDVDRPQLLYEYKVYRLLRGEDSPWVPKMYWYGQSGDYNVLVMELLGPSLHKLWEAKQSLPIDYVLRIAPKMIQRIEMCHSNGILHRDIKLENFVVAPHDHEHIYLIDFGLSKSFIKDRQHIPMREGKGFVGTARMASCNVHLGLEQGRRDDLEGLAYVLIYLCKGSLPWQNAGGATRQARNRAIGQIKQRTRPSDLCRGLPPCFESYLTYVKGLQFDEEPDYLRCRSMFLE